MSWSTRKLQFRCIFQPQNWGKLQHRHFQVFYTITRSMSTSTLYRIRPSWHVRALNWLPKSNILILQFIVLVSINMLQLVSMSWSCPPSCASLRLPTPPLRSFPASHNFRRFGMNNCSTGLNSMVVLRFLMEISKPNFFDNGPLTPRSCIIIPDFPSRTSSTSFNGYHPMWWFIMLIMKFIASPCFVLPSILSLLAERGMILNCFPVFLEMKKMLKSSLLLLWHRPCRTDIDGGLTHPRHCLTALYIWNERRCSTKDVHWFRILVHAMANSCRPPPELLIRCAWCFGRKKPVNFLFLKFGNISINSFSNWWRYSICCHQWWSCWIFQQCPSITFTWCDSTIDHGMGQSTWWNTSFGQHGSERASCPYFICGTMQEDIIEYQDRSSPRYFDNCPGFFKHPRV